MLKIAVASLILSVSAALPNADGVFDRLASLTQGDLQHRTKMDARTNGGQLFASTESVDRVDYPVESGEYVSTVHNDGGIAALTQCGENEVGGACRRLLALLRANAFQEPPFTIDIRMVETGDQLAFEPRDLRAARTWVAQDRAVALPVLQQLAVSQQSWVSLFGRLALVEVGELALTQPNFPDAWGVDGQPSLGLFYILQWMESPQADVVIKQALSGAENDIDLACRLSGRLFDNPRQRLAPWMLGWAKRILSSVPLAQQPQLVDFTEDHWPTPLSRTWCIAGSLKPLWSRLPEQDELSAWMTEHPNRAYQLIGALRQMEVGEYDAAHPWPALLRKEHHPKLTALADDIEADLQRQE